MKYLKIIIPLYILAAIVTLIKDRLDELTDKYWEGNRQIALYSDEVNKLKRKRAHWKINSDGYYPYCSNCGYEPETMTDYCGGCGYDMREGEQ